MIFSGVKAITIPEGKVKKITASGYTNLVPLSTEADGVTIYNGGLGYKNGYRIRSGGAEGESTAHSCTGYMPCKAGGVLRVIPSTEYSDRELISINVYNASKTNLGQLAYNGKYGIFAGTAYAWSNVDGVYTFTVPTDITNASDIAFVRITTNSRDGAVTIITINEPIADVVLWESGGLPSIYQQVEYIASNGKQQIDTGILASNYPDGIQYSLDFKLTAWSSTNEYCIFFGAYANNSWSGSLGVNAYNGNFRSFCGSGEYRLYKWSNILNLQCTLGTFANSNNPKGMTCSIVSGGAEKLVSYSWLSPSSTAMPSANIYLFNCNGVATSGPTMQCNGFKMHNVSGTLICDLVPCYRKSDGVIGMYDLVRRTFLTNVGSGNFTKGANV